MKVILLSDVYKHGVAGEIVKVADGFARNYLIPKGLAVQATKSELKRTNKLREQVEARRAAYENKLNDLARQIDGTELIFGRRAAVTGKLFGSVTTQEIAEALNEKTGVDINRRRISQQGLREVGTHMVPVRLGSENPPILKIVIVREEELAEFLAARERGEDVEIEAVDSGDAEAETPEEADVVAEMETEILPQSMLQEAVEQAAQVAQEQAEADTES